MCDGMKLRNFLKRATKRERTQLASVCNGSVAYLYQLAGQHRQLKPAVEGNSKVLIGFTLSDLYAESFIFKSGDKTGDTGISLKARLLRIAWAKVDGQPRAARSSRIAMRS